MTNAPLSITPMGFIAVSGFAEARAFYQDVAGPVLGLAFVSQDDFALVLRSGPILIRLTVPPQRTVADYTVFGWQVSDIDRVVSELTARGIVFEIYAFFGDSQSAQGIWTAPGGDRVAWFRDPDGNLLSVSQHVAA
jgi:catechol 2,3-dioxygenase-like lactoylglutathione lyase family enzyme